MVLIEAVREAVLSLKMEARSLSLTRMGVFPGDTDHLWIDDGRRTDA